MMHHMGDVVTLVNEKVQKQLGASDCGLFAVPFATDLCHGIEPTNQSYDQDAMREHYVSCFESRTITHLFQQPLGEFPITWIQRR